MNLRAPRGLLSATQQGGRSAKPPRTWTGGASVWDGLRAVFRRACRSGRRWRHADTQSLPAYRGWVSRGSLRGVTRRRATTCEGNGRSFERSGCNASQSRATASSAPAQYPECDDLLSIASRAPALLECVGELENVTMFHASLHDFGKRWCVGSHETVLAPSFQRSPIVTDWEKGSCQRIT